MAYVKGVQRGTDSTILPWHIDIAGFTQTSVPDILITLAAGTSPTTTSNATTVTTVPGMRYLLCGFAAYQWQQDDPVGWPYNANGAVGINGSYKNVVRCDPRGGTSAGSIASGASFCIPFVATGTTTSITARMSATLDAAGKRPTLAISQTYIIQY